MEGEGLGDLVTCSDVRQIWLLGDLVTGRSSDVKQIEGRHMSRSPRPSPSIFAYCKQSNTGASWVSFKRDCTVQVLRYGLVKSTLPIRLVSFPDSSQKAERGSGVLSDISCHMGWGRNS